MALDCDVLIVGGGIAGLTSALRLASSGARVVVLERDGLGAGSTLSNPGVVHGGALYAQLHPHLAAACSEAVAAFRASLPGTELAVGRSRYLAQPRRMAEFRRLWHRLGIPFEAVPRDHPYPDLDPAGRASVEVSLVQDLVIDTRQVLVDLTARCLAASVQFGTLCPVRSLVREGDVVLGATVGLQEDVRAAHTVLACGVGAAALLRRAGSRTALRVKSRLSTIAAVPATGLGSPIMGLDYGSLCVVPSGDGRALVTRYGVPVTWLAGRPAPAVSADEFRTIQRELSRLVRAGVLDLEQGWVWSASKTEMSQGTADQWGVEPAFAAVDHSAEEGLSGLWTVVPGKMTLALHASRRLAELLTGAPGGLDLPSPARPVAHHLAEAGTLVAAHPWRQVEDPAPVDGAPVAVGSRWA